MRCWLLLLGACVGAPDAFEPLPGGEARVRAVFDPVGAFWEAPYPSDHRVDPDSRLVDLAGFPDPEDAPIIGQLLELVDGQVQGWSVSGAITVPFDGPVDPAGLPTLADSVTEAAQVFVMDVDPEGRPGRRYPIDVVARASSSAYEAPHAIVALPPAGLTLPSRRRLALVVLDGVEGGNGLSVGRPRRLEPLFTGEVPRDWRLDVTRQYQEALDVLEDEGVDPDAIAGLTVFTTGRPVRGWDRLVDAALETDGFQLRRSLRFEEADADRCVYQGTFDVPVFQEGDPPYLAGGGDIAVDGDDAIVQRREEGRIFVTVPNREIRGPRPTVVFVRTGAGGDVPLVDRGPRAEPGVDPPGGGYASTFARAGWAAVQVDGPLGGLRNPTGGDEQFLIFNISNPGALRGNLLQSAVELVLLPDLLTRLAIPSGTCPNVPDDPRRPIRFDAEQLVLFGHSMGATIGPLALAASPAYRGAILSGAGGSWIENVVHKEQPVATRPLAAGLLQEDEAALDRYHPALSLLQWVGEPVDPPMHAPSLVRGADPAEALHVLMFQGIEDGYIPPPVANAMTIALGLDVAGPVLDTTTAYRGIEALLGFGPGTTVPLPVLPNVEVGSERVLAVLTQHAEDGIEDGHEVVYQDPWSYHQVRCFLEGLAAQSRPVLADVGVEGDPCPFPPSGP